MRLALGAFLLAVAMPLGYASSEFLVTPTRNESEVKVVLKLGSRAAIKEECANLGVTLGKEGGCAVFYEAEKRCFVRAPMPTNVNDDEAFRLLGHEVAHCFWGRYHQAP